MPLRSQVISYVDAGNVIHKYAIVKSADNPDPVSIVDLVFVTISGTGVASFTTVLAVKHCSQAGGPPYWTESLL